MKAPASTEHGMCEQRPHPDNMSATSSTFWLHTVFLAHTYQFSLYACSVTRCL